MLARLSRFVFPPLIVLAALVAYRLIAGAPPQRAMVLSRNEPRTITPRFDDPRVVTDEQLAADSIGKVGSCMRIRSRARISGMNLASGCVFGSAV